MHNDPRLGMKAGRLLVALFALMLGVLACGLPGSQSDGDPANTAVPAEAEPTIIEEDAPPPAVIDVPAGLKVVFVNEGNVWLWTEDGGAAPLTTSGGVTDVRFSDDASVIAFVQRSDDHSQFSLHAVNIDGSNERLLVSMEETNALRTDDVAAGIQPHQLAWIPGTHLLAYSTGHIYTGTGGSLPRNNDLHVVEADTQQQQTLLEAGKGGNFYLSPDGSQAAIATIDGISLFKLDDSDQPTVLLSTQQIALVESFFVAQPVWSPDGRSMGAVLPPDVPFSEPSGESTTWSIPTDGSPPTQLGTFVTSPIPQLGPRFSPDLSKVAYPVRIEGSEDVWELRIANADGSGNQVYDSGSDLRFIGWAPDLLRFLYVVDLSPLVGQLDAAPVQPTDVQMIAPDTNFMWVDNERYLYLAEGGLSWKLRLATVGADSVLLSEVSLLQSPFYGRLLPPIDVANN